MPKRSKSKTSPWDIRGRKGRYQRYLKFNGELYRHFISYKKKSKAKKHASDLRKNGWRVRVVKRTMNGDTAWRLMIRRK